ncbi:b(0,+)-type amino acid transporter 1-like [Octopus vulgaris]|uniref:b(0,+)-type amino acid transporter 1 n=2 Tax=Octopus vulgaris TaxID=6645 RepID=A0AA36AQ35_OCTVU|nr:b(0,+)-type amino acid transporter 1-like [Octopus vulgaris]
MVAEGKMTSESEKTSEKIPENSKSDDKTEDIIPEKQALNPTPDKQHAMVMEKSVGLFSAVALIVGTMIGSGIFISPKGVLIGGGSVALSLIIWFLCGLLATLGSLCYAELGAAIPKSGGEYAYLIHTFAASHPTWGPVPAFLFAWLAMFVIRPGMVSIMVMSLGTYASKPFYGDCEPPVVVVKLITITVLVFIAFINATSVKFATKIQNVLTITKIAAIIIITVGGFYYMAIGKVDFISEGFLDTSVNPSDIALGFYNGLWAYDGWNNLNFVTEELKDPFKNLPRAIMIGIPTVTFCYILVNIGYFTVMSKEEILMSNAVAVVWGKKVLGVMAWIMPVFVVLSCFGAANGSLFSSGRLNLVVARGGHLVKALSFIHAKRRTPIPSIIFTTVVGIFLIMVFELGNLIEFFSFTAWIFHGLTCLCVIILRRTQKDLRRPYRVPIFVPVLVILGSIYLIVTPIILNPRIEFLYAFMFVISGLLVYFPFIHYKLRFPYINEITEVVQKILLIAPIHAE